MANSRETSPTVAAADPLAWIEDELRQLEDQNLRRRLLTHAGPRQAAWEIGGETLINFGSNDYLGLAADPRLSAAAARAAAQEGWGAGASPLVTGHGAAHRALEHDLAQFEQTEAALLFSSGYAANVGTITSLAGRGDVIYADAKNHASMIDGCRLSRAAVHVYSHADASSLEKLLRAGGSYRRRLIVTESVFSMDGDFAPLAELAALAEQYEAMLLVDEAHATGVLGERGSGLCEALGVEQRVAVRIGTLSKALGSVGGFVCGNAALIDWLMNRARPYVFSTASPPALAAAGSAALAIVREESWRRTDLQLHAAELRAALQAQGWNIGRSQSHIIPLIVGQPEQAVDLAAQLRKRGLIVPAIRPPSVPAGQSLVRISLSSGHTPAMLAALQKELYALRGLYAGSGQSD